MVLFLSENKIKKSLHRWLKTKKTKDSATLKFNWVCRSTLKKSISAWTIEERVTGEVIITSSVKKQIHLQKHYWSGNPLFNIHIPTSWSGIDHGLLNIPSSSWVLVLGSRLISCWHGACIIVY